MFLQSAKSTLNRLPLVHVNGGERSSNSPERWCMNVTVVSRGNFFRRIEYLFIFDFLD